jgi:hypothetical protein
MIIVNIAIGFKGFGREAASDMNRARNELSGCPLVVTIRPRTPMRNKARVQGVIDMRRFSFFTFFWALLCGAQISGLGQETLSTTGQSLEGTWIAQVAQPGGEFAPFGLGTFSPNGSYLGTTSDPTQSSHHGVWLRAGDRKFVLSTMFFTRDEKGAHSGIVRTRIAITLADDSKSYTATVERILMDVAGRELQVIKGIRGRSVRMDVETQENPVEP